MYMVLVLESRPCMTGQVVHEGELRSLFSPLGAPGRISGCEFDEGDGFDPASTRNRLHTCPPGTYSDRARGYVSRRGTSDTQARPH